MKKVFLFAALIAAMTFAFTACDNGNTTVDPSNYNYAGQKWRVDSCKMQGQLERGPHALIDIRSDKDVILNGRDTTTYHFESGKLIVFDNTEQPMELTIKKAEETFALLEMDGLELYLSRIPESNGNNVAITADNIIGKWHWDWYYNEYYHYIYEWEKWYTDYNIGTTFGVDTWEFKADGTLIKHNIYDAMMGAEQENITWWELDAANNRIAMGFDYQKKEEVVQNGVIPDGYWYNINTLTDNVFYYGTEEHSTTDKSYQIHKWYLSKVK